MNSKTTIKKLTLGSLALAAVAGAGLAFTPNAAHADTSSRPGMGVLKSLDGGQTWDAEGRELDAFVVTFDRPVDPEPADGVAKLGTGQLILPSQNSYDGIGATGVLLNTSGDNTWAGAATGTFRLTFNGQTTASVFGEPVTFTATVQAAAAVGDDINIGVGELQECTISKSMDSTSPELGQFAADESSDGSKGGNVEFEWKVEEGES